MYIETLITKVSSSIAFLMHSYELRILQNMSTQLLTGTTLTLKQANLSISILKKYETKISTFLGQNIGPWIDNPQFKYPFRTISSGKTISIVEYPEFTRAIKIQFPYDEELLKKFREQKGILDYAIWDKDEKSWFLNLNEKSIQFSMTLMNENGFTGDEQFNDYVKQVLSIRENIASCIPMAVLDENLVKFVNTSSYTPQNQSIDFLESMIFAKNVGITTWDNKIDEKIENLPNKLLKKFIIHDPGKSFDVDLNQNSLFDLLPAIKNLLPCLVIISPSKELEKLEYMLNLFLSAGIDNTEMSVLFRLPSETGTDFNNFVKNNNLNSPISENSKVIFIGNDIPKTIFKADIEFNSVLNYNYYSAHYKIRNFIITHKNVINILEKTQKER
jgi:hypothetical protein